MIVDKTSFQHNMGYGDFKDLTRRTASDKILRDKVFNAAKNAKCDRYRHGFAAMVYRFFDKKTSDSGIKNENILNKELAEELHKPIIRKFNKRKVQSPFIENIWGADLSDMLLINKFNKGFRFLFCVTDIYSKYTWVIPLKDKNGTTITNAFQNFLKESNRRGAMSKGRKPIKIWVDKAS